MATRKGINISRHYVVSINTIYAFSYMYLKFKTNERLDRIVFYNFIRFTSNPSRRLYVTFELK